MTMDGTGLPLSIQQNGVANWSKLISHFPRSGSSCRYESQKGPSPFGSLPHLWRQTWREM